MNPPSGSRKKRRKNADSAHLISTSSHPIPIKIPSILISSELHTRLLVGREFNFSYISGLNILNIKWLLLQTGVACKTVKPGIATGLISPKKKCMPETKVPIFHWLFWPIQLKRKGSLCKIYQHIIWKQRSNLFNWKNRGGFLVTEKNPKIQPRYVRSCGCVTYFGGSSSSSKDSDISSHIIWNLNRDLKLFASPAPEWSSPGQPSIALDLQIEFDWMHHSNSKLQKARAPNRWLFLAAAPFVYIVLSTKVFNYKLRSVLHVLKRNRIMWASGSLQEPKSMIAKRSCPWWSLSLHVGVSPKLKRSKPVSSDTNVKDVWYVSICQQ